jgi:acetyl esterase/lipase
VVLYLSTENTFGCSPKHIIIVGDSAGGNLAAAVTARCVMEKTRVPDGCLLAYPALHIDIKYTPSYLNILNNRMLPFSFLLVCMDSYAPAHMVDRSDPLLSPFLLPDEILAQFPPTRILVGTHDPFHDDCVRFAYRIHRLTRHQDAMLRVYEGVSHGFLNLAIQVYGVDVFQNAVLLAAKYMEKLLGRSVNRQVIEKKEMDAMVTSPLDTEQVNVAVGENFIFNGVVGLDEIELSKIEEVMGETAASSAIGK